MKNLKNFFKYLIFLAIGMFFLKLAFKGFDFKELLEGVKKTNYIWLIIALISNLLSHFFRAMRWKYLLLPLDNKSSTRNLFISDMSGLFINLFLPRLGEIFRCTTLKRLDNTPIDKSLSSVIIERSFDVLVFILISIFLFFLYKEKFISIIKLVPIQNILSKKSLILLLAFIMSFLSIFIFVRYIFVKYIEKIKKAFVGFLMNFKIILKNDKKVLICILSIFIWIFYFFSIYLVFFSMKETSHLHLDAGLIILIASSLGLSAPIQGSGAGALHLFVIYAFSLFDIPKNISLLSASLIHSVQFLTALVPGGLNYLASFFMSSKKN